MINWRGLFLACLLATGARAVQMPPVFGDHMVLQRDLPFYVWGIAPTGELVHVRFGDQSYNARAGANGRWRVKFEPMPASATGRDLIAGDHKISDVVVGDVWLCSGQSNMKFPLRQAAGSANDIATATNGLLRLLNFSGVDYRGGKLSPDAVRSISPLNYFSTDGWKSCSPEAAAAFSAVAFYFGRKLQQDLNAPVGLIHNAVGGAPIESFLPGDVMDKDAILRPLREDWLVNRAMPRWCQFRARQELGISNDVLSEFLNSHPFAPGFLAAAGFEPFTQFQLRGIVWYQGESNATEGGFPEDPGAMQAPNEYKLQKLIQTWRQRWVRPDMPFLFVQLPGVNRDWAEFRESQARVARAVTNCAMAVTIDAGHPTDVHPMNKLSVGERLALLAEKNFLGRDVVAEGPVAISNAFRGAEVVVHFANAAGLSARGGGAIVGFTIAGADRIFRPASARIDGDTVIVSSPDIPAPTALRYAWGDFPANNLVNGAGLPAAPFRTDAWPRLRVACIGDSITQGYGLTNRMTQSYPAQLQELLGSAFLVREFGDAGRGVVHRSKRGGESRAYVDREMNRQARAFTPDVVICNLGINDIMDWDKHGKTDFVPDYRGLIASYRSLPSKPKMLIWGKLAPLFPGQEFYGDARVDKINAALAEVAKAENVPTVDLFEPLKDHADWFQADHLHPNATGSRKIAEVVFGGVRGLAR